MTSTKSASPTSLPQWVEDTLATVKPLSTVKEATVILRLCDRQVRRKVAEGSLGAIRCADSGSSHVLIPRAALAKFLMGCVGSEAL